MPPLMPAAKLRPHLPSTTTVPRVMYSQPWSPSPSTTARAPELRTAKRSPPMPLKYGLASKAPGDVEQHVLVAVIVVGHQAIGIVARCRDQQAEARNGPGAGDGEAALVVAAAFGQYIELGSGFGAARDEIDDTRVGIGAVDGGLRAADDIDMVDGFARDVSEIKTQAATETNHRDAVDFHQVQVGIAAAQEEAGHAAGGAGLIERHAGKVAQQVHRK